MLLLLNASWNGVQVYEAGGGVTVGAQTPPTCRWFLAPQLCLSLCGHTLLLQSVTDGVIWKLCLVACCHGAEVPFDVR